MAGPVPVVWCGGVLLSHTLPCAVPSALRVLASGFGMGPGVSPALWPPQPWSPARPGAVGWSAVDSRAAVVFGCPVPGVVGWETHSGRVHARSVCGEVVGLLVPVGFAGRWFLLPRPAYQPSGLLGASPLAGWKSHLEAGFPLRCFQRLSIPNVAKQRCTWRYNCHTRGSSVPVLSY